MVIMVSSETMARLALRILAVALVLLTSVIAAADGRVDFLAERLRYPPAAGQPDDFRVRTNAALALGATNDDAAVPPLCRGLDDPSEVVRQAVAVGLKRLARSSALDCLRRRAAVESHSSVKLQIQRAIEAIESAGGGGGGGGNGGGGDASYVAGAKYYVSISLVANKTDRAEGDVDRIVRGAVASKLAQLGGYQLAPSGESVAAAKAAMAKRQLKGFFLAVSVDPFDYSDGSLRVRLKIAVFSYPGRDLRGEVPAGATFPGERPGDHGAEDQMLGVVAGRAAELFAQNFK
jgi:hypothetical protein